MVSWEVWFAIIPGLILFRYGIEQFSDEMQRVAGEKFRALLGRMTKNPVGGAALGALVTGIVQSSTATTVITVGLVNAGTIPFAQSLGVIFGANVGTTITSQLVAFNVMWFAPVFIFLGFLLNGIGGKYKFLGKPIFYFGLVFFSLSLVSDAIGAISQDGGIMQFFAGLDSLLVAILVGIVLTAVFQSSSVTTGIVVLLAGGGLITLGQGIPIILGANIGTTAMSLFISMGMDLYAKRAAAAHFLFNLGGVLMFLPFLGPFTDLIASQGGTAANQVANAHLVFNLVCAAVFLALIGPFKKVVERMVPGEEEEIIFKAKHLEDRLPESNAKALQEIEKELQNATGVTLSLFEESAGSMIGKKGASLNRARKLKALVDFLNRRMEASTREVGLRKLTDEEARRTILLVRMSNIVEQVGDKGEDLAHLLMDRASRGEYMSPEAMVEFREIYEKMAASMRVACSAPRMGRKEAREMKANDISIRALINSAYEKDMKRIRESEAYAGSFFVEAVSILEAANAWVREMRKLSDIYSSGS